MAGVTPGRTSRDTLPMHGFGGSAFGNQIALRRSTTRANRGSDQQDLPRPTAPGDEGHRVPASTERSGGEVDPRRWSRCRPGPGA